MRYIINGILLTILCVVWIDHVDAEKGLKIGCYEISNSNSQHRISSVDECVDLCEKSYFEIAAVSGATCTCSESIQTNELNETECNIKCAGNSAQICGGPMSESCYKTGIVVAGPVRNVRQVDRTQTSITLRWDEPQQRKYLKNYIVRVNPIKTFARSLLPGQWTVAKDSNQVDLTPLHPGTTYLIEIVSNSDQGREGGVASVTIQTEIGIPEPEPQQPTVLSRTDTTIVIEIKPQTNINGPISFYQVIVLYVDQLLVQQFDETLLTDFKQAQEDGSSYYIAAELEYQDTVRRFTVGDGRYYREYQNIALRPNSHVHVSIGIISKMGNETTRRYASTSHEQHDVMIEVRDDQGGGK